MRQRAPIVKIRSNSAKIKEAIVFLIGLGARQNKALSQYDIVKALFLADRRHLNEYGRPVIFDNYTAMEHGPVPSLAYDFLKSNDAMPWKKDKAEKAKFHFHSPEREADEELLSPSDFDALSDALTTVKSLGFAQIRKLTHEDQAYVDAWDPEDGSRKAFDMSYAMLFDVPSLDKALELAFASEHV